MAVSEKEAIQFAMCAVDYDPAVLAASNPERKTKLLRECRENALGYYAKACQDVRDSGFRCTQRVKDIIWRTLTEIRDRARAPATLPVSAVTSLAMVTGGEKTHPIVIMKGRRHQWVGIGWIDEGDACDSDKRKYPMVQNVEIAGMPI